MIGARLGSSPFPARGKPLTSSARNREASRAVGRSNARGKCCDVLLQNDLVCSFDASLLQAKLVYSRAVAHFAAFRRISPICLPASFVAPEAMGELGERQDPSGGIMYNQPGDPVALRTPQSAAR